VGQCQPAVLLPLGWVLLPAAAQVYYARVRATGQPVAVKVQRPGALSTISKDLYVMRRGVGVYEQLVKRFTAQTTDYQQLLSTFAEGLYTEMDFRNEVGGVCVGGGGLSLCAGK
jgi:predicted unusual protein kinase regulating ubiquinone biosynthesis (AarF/ABC1/UbiB family)